ncbi:MAG: RNA polymerase sigma factor [Planctomycetota bacterium]
MSRSTRWSLITAVALGDDRAQSAFVSAYRPTVLRYVERQGVGAAAEDVTQDVFVRLMVKGGLERVVRGTSFRAYLFTVTRNALLDHLRRAGAERRGGNAEIVPLLEQEPSVDERESFDREWLLNLLEVSLARLEREHPSYYVAVKGFVWDERPQAELAAEAGCSVQDVRNHVHRGRKKLAAYIKEEIARYERDPGRFATEVEAVSRLLQGA